MNEECCNHNCNQGRDCPLRKKDETLDTRSYLIGRYDTSPVKTLTNEEILCLWDWWSGEILSTDILDFADTYKRVLLGEEGLLEWHQEYVKKMNDEENRIAVLEANHKIQLNIVKKQQEYIKHLEEGLESCLNLSKAQAERHKRNEQ